jgi:hypothetical protein
MAQDRAKASETADKDSLKRLVLLVFQGYLR